MSIQEEIQSAIKDLNSKLNNAENLSYQDMCNLLLISLIEEEGHHARK